MMDVAQHRRLCACVLVSLILAADWGLAQTIEPPAPPDVPPLIARTYSSDPDGSRIDNGLESKLAYGRMLSSTPGILGGRAIEMAMLAAFVDVELIFDEPITQQQIDEFQAMGGEITYVYTAVSYGWNARIPLGRVESLPARMGGTLVLVDELKPARLHMRLATQTGRVRPVWANGFGGGPGYDGSSDISIAILDTGVDDSHTDLAGRKAFWKDYTSDGEMTPRDIIQHGTHVTGIALGTGAAHGVGTVLRFTDSGNLSGASSGSFFPSLFDFPEVSTTWTAVASWIGTGPPRTLHHAHTTKGTSGSYFTDGSSSGSSPLTHSNTLTPLAVNAYTAALLKSGNMSTYAVANTLTSYGTVGDGFNTLSGVAPGAQWVGAKVFTNSGSGSGLDINAAVDDMVALRITYNIKVINMSLGITGTPGISTSLRQKVNTAAANGILTVTSAGNEGTESTSGAREIGDPGRAAMALTIGSTNDVNALTDYTSHGFTSPGSVVGQEEDYKPDILAPGGSFYYSSIMSTDSNDADGGNISFSDVVNNDYYNITGTSMASPFVAGSAALVIDALQSTGNLTGVAWDFSSSNDVRLVKMLLTATATETNADREIAFGFNPSLQRASAGPDGFPVGKDRYEGFGMLNVDAAVEGGSVFYTPGDTVGDTLGGNEFSRRAWARRVSLTSGTAFDPSLTVPGTGDFDLYLYSLTPSAFGTPVLLASSATSGNGVNESLSHVPGSSYDAILVVKRVSGEGTFSLTSTASTPQPSIVDAHPSPQANFPLPDFNTTETDKMSALKFRIKDRGGDSQDTLIDQLSVAIAGTAGEAANDIAWAELHDGTAQVAVATSITNSLIVFGAVPNSDSAAQLDSVADGAQVDYTMNVYLNASLNGLHDETYVFDVDESLVGVDGGSSSPMATDTSAVTPVTGTLFITAIGISVTPGSWAIGPQVIDAVLESGPYTVSNEGNVAEDISISASHGANGWVLSSSVGVDGFTIEVDKADDGSYETVLSTSDQAFVSAMPAPGSESLGLRYSAPSGDTQGPGLSQDFNVTVKASRHVP